MMGQRKVLAPHAELKAGQSEGKCSLMLCLPRAELKVGQSGGECSPMLCGANVKGDG